MVWPTHGTAPQCRVTENKSSNTNQPRDLIGPDAQNPQPRITAGRLADSLVPWVNPRCEQVFRSSPRKRGPKPR